MRDFGGDNFSEVGKELAEEKFLPLLSQKSESEKLRITGILVAVTASTCHDSRYSTIHLIWLFYIRRGGF